MARRRNTHHARLYDFRDIDLMLKLAAEGNEEGWSETREMADSLGFGEDAMPIAQRFSWMRRYGMLEYDREKRMWRLSAGGERVTKAHLRAAQQKTIEELPDESMIEVMSHVTSRYQRGEPMLAHMLRREFLFGTQKR